MVNDTPDWIDGPRVLAVQRAALKVRGCGSTVDVGGLRIELYRPWKPEGRLWTLCITASGTTLFHICWTEDLGSMEYGNIFFGSWMDKLAEIASASSSNWSA